MCTKANWNNHSLIRWNKWKTISGWQRHAKIETFSLFRWGLYWQCKPEVTATAEDSQPSSHVSSKHNLVNFVVSTDSCRNNYHKLSYIHATLQDIISHKAIKISTAFWSIKKVTSFTEYINFGWHSRLHKNVGASSIYSNRFKNCLKSAFVFWIF